MTQEKIFNESEAHRNHNAGYYDSLCVVYANKAFGQDREFSGSTMTWDYYESTSPRYDYDDIQITVFIDFNAHTIKVTAEK